MKKQHIISIFIVSCLLFSIVSTKQITGEIEEDFTNIKLNALVSHVPINITSNADFGNYAIISGDGSPGTPYLIDSLNITTTDEFGITISDVSVYFIIQNCFMICFSVTL